MICPNCGKEFQTNRSNQIYCSADCRMIYTGKKRREESEKIEAKRRETEPPKICVVCGKQFTTGPHSRHQVCCSRECSVINNRNHNNQSHKMKREEEAKKGKRRKPRNELARIMIECEENHETYGDYQRREYEAECIAKGDTIHDRYVKWKAEQERKKARKEVMKWR